MGDYLSFQTKRRSRRKRRSVNKKQSSYLLVRHDEARDDGTSRTCMPNIMMRGKQNKASRSVHHTEQSEDWEDYLGSTTSSEPLLPPDPWKGPTMQTSTISPDPTDDAAENSTTLRSKQPQHHLLIPPTPTNRRPGTEQTTSEENEPDSNSTSNVLRPQYPSTTGSFARPRRTTYEGEAEPDGIRGQEATAVVGSSPTTTTTSSTPLPSMRSFHEGQHSQDPFVVSPLTDAPETASSEEDSFTFSMNDETMETTASSINIERMRSDLLPTPEKEAKETPTKRDASNASTQPTPNTLDLEQMERDLLRISKTTANDDADVAQQHSLHLDQMERDFARMSSTNDYEADSSSSNENDSSVEESSSQPVTAAAAAAAAQNNRPKAPLAGTKTSSFSNDSEWKMNDSNDFMDDEEEFQPPDFEPPSDFQPPNFEPPISPTVSQDANDDSGMMEHPSFTMVAPLDDSFEEQVEEPVPYTRPRNAGAGNNGLKKNVSDVDFSCTSGTDQAASSMEGVAYQSLLSTSSTMSDDFKNCNVSPIRPPPRSNNRSTRSVSSSRSRNLSMRHSPTMAKQVQVEELNAAAIRHVEMGEYNHALDLFETVLDMYVKQYGTVHPLVASTRHNLGLVHSKRASLMNEGCVKQEALTQSLKQFQSAARCARDSLGKNHPNVAASLVRIGFLLMDCKEFDKAAITFQEALRIRLECYGPEHTLVANLWNDLGVCHTHLQNWSEALQMTTMALDTQRALLDNSKTPDPKLRLEIADTLCNMGGLYLERMQHSMESPQFVDWARHAVSAFCEALDIRTRVLQDASHPLVVQARSLHDMAQATFRDLKRKHGRTTMASSSPIVSSPFKSPRSFGSEDDLSSRFFQSSLDDSSFEIKRGSWPSSKRKNMPREVMIQEEEEGDSDSLGNAPSRRRPDGSTKIWVSPHVIPTRSPPRGSISQQQNDEDDNDTDNAVTMSLEESLTNDEGTAPSDQAATTMQTTPRKRERTYSYDAEESCLIGTDGNNLTTFPPFEEPNNTARPGVKHEIMVVQPQNTFDEKAIQPLVSRKTISWAQAVHQKSPPNHVDSPSLVLKDQDSIYDIDQADLSGGGAKAVVVTRQMMENPEAHLQEIHRAASKFMKENRLQEADILFETVLQCQRQKHGELHEEVGAAFHNVGLVHLRAERHLQALDAFEKAVRVRKGALGRDHPDVAVSLVKVGITQLLLSRFEMALMAFRDALSIRRHSLGSLHPSLARIYSNIGCVHLEFNEVKEARRAFEGALDIQRNALCEEPDSGPLMFGTATTLCNLGYLYHSREMYGKAAVIFKEAVALQEVVLGPTHPTVLQTLDSLADANTKCNNCATALKCYYEILQRFPKERETDGKVKSHRRKRAEAVILYKMSRVHRKQNDKESELEKLGSALVIVQELAQVSNNPELIERLEHGIQNDIRRVQGDLSMSDFDWV